MGDADKIAELGGGVFDCFDDSEVCIYTCFLPCCAYGTALAEAREGECVCNTIAAMIPCWIPCW